MIDKAPEITMRLENVAPVRALLAAGLELLATIEAHIDRDGTWDIPAGVVEEANRMRALVDEWVEVD